MSMRLKRLNLKRHLVMALALTLFVLLRIPYPAIAADAGDAVDADDDYCSYAKTAHELRAGRDELKGYIEELGDSDWAVIKVPRSGRLTVALSVPDGPRNRDQDIVKDYDVEIWNENCVDELSAGRAWPGVDEKVTIDAPAGEYRVRVHGAPYDNHAYSKSEGSYYVLSSELKEIQIQTLELYDLEGENHNLEPLRFLSADDHPYFKIGGGEGNTLMKGEITITGESGDQLQSIVLEVKSGTTVLATAQLYEEGPQLPDYYLTKTDFGFDETLRRQASILFRLPASEGVKVARWVGDKDLKVTLNVKATARSGSVSEKNWGSVPVLVQYGGTNRFGTPGADQCTGDSSYLCGGDDWVLPSVRKMLDHFSSDFNVNDISNMNGGYFPPHAPGYGPSTRSHEAGYDVDALFAGYSSFDENAAKNLVNLLKDTTYGKYIKKIYAEYIPDSSFEKVLRHKDNAIDGCPAINYITNVPGHTNHFHIVFDPAYSRPRCMLTAPTDLVGIVYPYPGGTGISWKDTSENEDGFTIYRSENKGTFSILATLGPNTTSYTDTTTARGNVYTYKVQAFNELNTAESGEVSIDAGLAPPEHLSATVNVLKSTFPPDVRMHLRWDDNNVDEEGFSLEVKKPGDSEFSELARLGPNQTSTDYTPPYSVGEFRFRIRAFRGGGYSDYPSEASGLYPRPIFPPPPPVPLPGYIKLNASSFYFNSYYNEFQRNVNYDRSPGFTWDSQPGVDLSKFDFEVTFMGTNIEGRSVQFFYKNSNWANVYSRPFVIRAGQPIRYDPFRGGRDVDQFNDFTHIHMLGVKVLGSSEGLEMYSADLIDRTLYPMTPPPRPAAETIPLNPSLFTSQYGDEFYADLRYTAFLDLPKQPDITGGVDLSSYDLEFLFDGPDANGRLVQLFYKDSQWRNVYSSDAAVQTGTPLRFNPLSDAKAANDFSDFTHIYAIGAKVLGGVEGVELKGVRLMRR